MITSTTVTVAIHVDVFPLASVPVKVTMFAPKSEQLNVVCDKLNVTPLQLSALPLSTSVVAIVATPDASKFTVTD